MTDPFYTSGSGSDGAGTAEPDIYSGESCTDAMLNLGSIKEAIRARRRLWVAAALLGMVIGAAFHLVLPAKYQAVTALYLVEPTNVLASTAMENDLSLLETTAVSRRAVADLHLNQSAESFLGSYTGTSISDVILQVKLSAATPAEAVHYETGLAKAFLAVRGGELTAQDNIVVSSLDKTATGLKSAVNSLTSQINSLSTASAGAQSASQVAALVNKRSADESQLSQVQSQVQQDRLATSLVVNGSKVLDPATVVPASSKKVIATDGLSGLVGGLGVGLGVVIVGVVLSDRPRSRADIAAALGAPVELSLGLFREPRWLRRSRLRRLLKRPCPELLVIERRLRARVEDRGNPALALVTVNATQPAALGISLLAHSLALEGKQVVLVDLAENRPLAHLLRAERNRGCPVTVPFSGGALTLVVAADDLRMTADECMVEEADVVLVLATLSPAVGAEHLATWADKAVVMTTAGRATSTLLSSTRRMLRHAGLSLKSVFVIGAGKEDESIGLVAAEPQDAHVAMATEAHDAAGDDIGVISHEIASRNGDRAPEQAQVTWG